MDNTKYKSMSHGALLLYALIFIQNAGATDVVYDDFYYSNYDSGSSSSSPSQDYNDFYYSNYVDFQANEAGFEDIPPTTDSLITHQQELSVLEKAASDLIDSIRSLEDDKKFEKVKTFLDRNIKYEEDKILYGVLDHWATLQETLKKGQGDCEDWALAAYMLLKRSGADMDKFLIEYRRAEVRPGEFEAHMVIARLSADGTKVIGDNLFSGLRLESERKDLQAPVYGFNENILQVKSVTAVGENPVVRLSRWRDVIERE